MLEGGCAGWQAAGGELFSGVNVPSKAFGEFVEHRFDTPRMPPEDLKRLLDRHAAAYAGALNFDLARKPRLDNLWVNVLKPGGGHSGHIHPHAFLSGTVYLSVPDGASSLKLEDPRLPMMMARPAVRADAPQAERPFVYLAPAEGTILMWESWLRHEVPPNGAKSERVSIRCNYA